MVKGLCGEGGGGGGQGEGRDRGWGKNLVLLDIWNMSMPREVHVDNVHGTEGFYELLGGLMMEGWVGE